MELHGYWTGYEHSVTPTEVLPLARGTYQRSILQGKSAVSGSTLRGKAKGWAMSYNRSLGHLLRRLSDAGYTTRIERVHVRNVLVIGRALPTEVRETIEQVDNTLSTVQAVTAVLYGS